MNMKLIEEVAKNTDKRWYVSQADLARMLGYERQTIAVFIKEHSIPHYSISGNGKRYFLPEVLEAIEKTKWKAG